jgi:hypothetical protein
MDHEDYDASYQQTDMEEEEHVEHKYCEQQYKRIQELHEKTTSTKGHYEPKTENTSEQNIGQIRLLVGKYKKI